ncbi:3-deoxy-D-manno-octulosonic-acid transferase [Lutibacter oceani]|uniref:3-deoxy-D-manno-octulosonic acid transferase n=1 Tax=Lutibacter oceani TaxID=1853311 RepID=A0A3D9S210_9FLAO|nr:glycosyltransferase N-terminal domain-containing protein [Lutibacter oceani]REE83346.1 3-deoxy-D-manno-octulosonic-acid transferase [Lutibacter oceani]
MQFLYNILVFKAGLLLKVIAFFNKKIKLFIDGRKETFAILKNNISPSNKVIWMHCASLGEFEQGRPILENLKKIHPNKKLVLTFFSPSGYEVRKNYKEVDVVCYLPLDSRKNAQQFLDIVHPETAIFVKYEFWPNLLKELKNSNVNTILISGIFRKNQLFFNWYGGWMRKSLSAFSHFFVQDEISKNLLNSIGFTNVSACGDTRFDRVYEITKQDNQLNFVSEFKNNNYTLVAGSTWKEDEDLLVDYINNKSSEKEKFIIAPHNINANEIQQLKKSILKKVFLYSEKEEKENLNNYQVLIVDTIGILTKIYSYADIAYVGGGYTKSGVHNVLEPATFGVPIIIGPNYNKFLEAKELVNKQACFVADNSQKLSVLLTEFFRDNKKRIKSGSQSLNYVIEKTGASVKILNYLK